MKNIKQILLIIILVALLSGCNAYTVIEAIPTVTPSYNPVVTPTHSPQPSIDIEQAIE
ncbi:MAG: lipoprotein, partial [Clostridiales bacterium]|nr:lipoprotein [Clostridiales bacterium]